MAELKGMTEHYVKCFMGCDYELLEPKTCGQLANRLEAIAKDIRKCGNDEKCEAIFHDGKLRHLLIDGIIQ